MHSKFLSICSGNSNLTEELEADIDNIDVNNDYLINIVVFDALNYRYKCLPAIYEDGVTHVTQYRLICS